MRQIAGAAIVFSLLMLLLTSCAATALHETRFIPRNGAKDWFYVRPDIQISCRPLVRLTSSCSGQTVASFGPYFIWPLPVIPNPFWPLQYLGFNKQQASFQLTVTAPPKTSKWENVNVEMLLNGNSVTAKTFEDHSDVSKDERQYNYEPGITCGELEGSKIDVTIIGFSEKIETKLLYTHQWHVHSYIGPYGGMWNHVQKTRCADGVGSN